MKRPPPIRITAYNKRHDPKIAFFDIENAPYIGYAWEKWETNIIEFMSGGYMLCFSIKWLGKSKIETYALPDFPNYKRDKENDFDLLVKLWELMSKADIIIAHNGDQFDIKKSNQRMLLAGMHPPEPYKTVDTLKLARRHFKFPSNKLDDIAKDLKLGRKLPHTGFHLWKGCMEGDPTSWLLMKRYNKQDVALLEKVYLKVRPWAANLPDLNVYNRTFKCPKCGSNKVERRGYKYSQTVKYQQHWCRECGGWFKGARVKPEDE